MGRWYCTKNPLEKNPIKPQKSTTQLSSDILYKPCSQRHLDLLRQIETEKSRQKDWWGHGQKNKHGGIAHIVVVNVVTDLLYYWSMPRITLLNPPNGQILYSVNVCSCVFFNKADIFLLEGELIRHGVIIHHKPCKAIASSKMKRNMSPHGCKTRNNIRPSGFSLYSISWDWHFLTSNRHLDIRMCIVDVATMIQRE